MKTLRKIVLSLLITLIVVNNVIAETGSIQVSDIQTSQYQYIGGAGGGDSTTTSQPMWDRLYFSNTSWEKISDFRINTTVSGTTFTYYFNSTNFICSSGGICSGVFYYDRNTSSIYYVFDSSSVFNSNVVNLSFVNNDIKNQITWKSTSVGTGIYAKDVSPTSDKPIAIHVNCSGFPTNKYLAFSNSNNGYTTTSASIESGTYNFTYNGVASQIIFSGEIIKSATVNSKIFFESLSKIYSNESSFNKNTMYFDSAIYSDGLYLNYTLQSGGYTKLLINSTGIISSEGFMTFNKTSYNLGDYVQINYTNLNYTASHDYYIKVCQITDTSSCYNHILNNKQTGSIVANIDNRLISNITASMYHNGIVTIFNSVQYGQSVSIDQITGNLSINKNQYTIGETVNISYNISVNGKVEIGCFLDGLVYSNTVNAGYKKYQDFYINKLFLYPCKVSLKALLNNEWITIDYKEFTTIQSMYSVEFLQSWIKQGEVITISYQTNNTPNYLILKDSNGVVKFNISVVNTGNTTQFYYYTVLSTDSIGTWTVYLNQSNITRATDTINILSVVVTPIVTSRPSNASILDATNDLSIGLFGDIERDSRGRITDEGIGKFGDKIFNTFILIVAIIVCLLVFSKRK